MCSISDFEIAFPRYSFLHARNLNPDNELAKQYVKASQDFNAEPQPSDEIERRNRTNKAYELLVSANSRFPNLLSTADSDGKPVAAYKAEHHLEVRKQPNFQGSFFQFELKASEIKEWPISPEFILEKWSIDKFTKRKEKHIPNIGFVEPKTFSKECSTRSFNLPIRMSGEKIVRVPIEYEYLRDFIERTANHAYGMVDKYKKSHPDFIDPFFYYLTVDQKFLEKGKKHRGPEPHTDDMQGPRYVLEKLPSGWTYLVSDLQPTTFYNHSFDLSGLNENKDDLWKALEGQADETQTYELEPYQIGLMSYFDIHRGTPMEKEARRTFVKLAITPKIFDMFGDSINPAFNDHVLESYPVIKYPWQYTSRKTPSFVELEKYQK